MIDRGQLIEALAPGEPWQKANKYVEDCIRQHFADYPELVLDNRDMVEAFLPRLGEGGRGAGSAARERLKRVLRNIKEHNGLPGYWTESSETKVLYGNTFHPTHWHAFNGDSSNVVQLRPSTKAKPKANLQRPLFLSLDGGTVYARADAIISVAEEDGGDFVSLIHLSSGENIESCERAKDIIALLEGQELAGRDASGRYLPDEPALTADTI